MAAPGNTGPATGAKRKSSTTASTGATRSVKRRASKACHCCRSRKVRCDVIESGIPCTNCRLDDVECLVTEGKRRKRSYVEGEVLHHSPIESIEEEEEEVQKFPLFDDIDGLQDLTLPAKQFYTSCGDAHTYNGELGHHRPHSIYQGHGHHMTSDERSRRVSNAGRAIPLSINTNPINSYRPYSNSIFSTTDVILPHYIATSAHRLPDEDLDYLKKKGAFLMPEVGIRNQLLRSYVQYVHPYQPLLDLQEFLSAVEKNQPGNTISLLLFQAVMFAASAFIDMRYLTAQGYASRKAARKAYFLRVKVLYDFDWEVDRVTVVQAVTLMTHWYETPNDPKDVWYWLGIAISIARTIGMNYNLDETSILTPGKRRLWKRIWWSIYLRDRIIAIGLRRPIRIRAEDCDVSELRLEDFETTPLTPELCRMLGGCSAVRDGSKRETLAKMCIALTTICHKITNVLSIQYSVLGHKIGTTSETTVRLVPKEAGAESCDILQCDRELEVWYNELPLEIRYFKPGSQERTNNHDGEVIRVHRALLSAIYLTAVSALHRPQMMPAMPNLVFSGELKDLSKQRVGDAALDITEIYRDLYVHDLIRYLPATGVTVLLPAIIIHLLDIKSPDSNDKQVSMRHFQFCMQALQKLRELYSSADFAFAFLDAAIRKADPVGTDPRPAHLIGFQDRQETTVQATTDRKKRSKETLTPPPDVQNCALKMMNHSSLTDFERSSLSLLMPPLSDYTIHSVLNSSAAVSLKDLENAAQLDGMSYTHQLFDTSEPMIGITNSFNIARPMTSGQSPLQVFSYPAPSYSSVDLEHQTTRPEGSTSPDLFAPNHCAIDDKIFKDIDMEWLADPVDDYGVDDHVHESCVPNVSTTFHHKPREARFEIQQPVTPISNKSSPSDKSPHSLMHEKPISRDDDAALNGIPPAHDMPESKLDDTNKEVEKQVLMPGSDKDIDNVQPSTDNASADMKSLGEVGERVITGDLEVDMGICDEDEG